MAFSDALQDSVTISSVTIGFKAGDVVGEEGKTLTPLYTDIPCRLMSGETKKKFHPDDSAFENYKNLWLIQVEPEYNGANRGDSAVVNGQDYMITKKHEIRGSDSNIHHVVYYLEEHI